MGNIDDGEDALIQMVDIQNNKGGGIEEAFKLLKTGINNIIYHHWVIEENNFQKAIRQDPRIKEYANKNGIILEGHETYKNKWDSHFLV